MSTNPEDFDDLLNKALSVDPAPTGLSGRILERVREPELDGRFFRRWAVPALAMACICMLAGYSAVSLTIDPMSSAVALYDGTSFDAQDSLSDNLGGDWIIDG